MENTAAPCGIVVLVEGIAINGERRLAGDGGFLFQRKPHKFTFNYGV
jgi:hypothetical protein